MLINFKNHPGLIIDYKSANTPPQAGAVDVLNTQVIELQASIAGDDAARRSIADPAVHRACSDQSLKTMMEICVRCLVKDPADRPSVEDVLWNLQFAAQVQDAWRGDSQSSDGSPISPSQPQRLHLSFH